MNITSPKPMKKVLHEPVLTLEDQETWRAFYNLHQSTVSNHRCLIHDYYLENISVLDVFKDHIPTLQEIQRILHPFGWSAQYVRGYHPPWKVFQMIHNQIMPLSSSIRPAEEVGFAREPDMIHDIFGHLPALLHPGYRDLLKRWSLVALSQKIFPIDRTLYHLNKTIVENKASAAETEALKKMSSELAKLDHVRLSPLQVIDKLYFWIFEFGIIHLHSGPKVLGAGLLSSLEELATIETRLSESQASKPALFKPLTLQSLKLPYLISDSQNTYATVDSIEGYERIIDQTAHMLTTDLAPKSPPTPGPRLPLPPSTRALGAGVAGGMVHVI